MTWFAVEIIFDGAEFGVVERYSVRNLSADKFREFRENIFLIGLYIPHKERAGEGEIIPPARLRKIFVVMQAKKFE